MKGPSGQAVEITTSLTVGRGKRNGWEPHYALEGQPRHCSKGAFSIPDAVMARLKETRGSLRVAGLTVTALRFSAEMELEFEVAVEAQPDRFQCAGDRIAVINTEFPDQ